MKGALTMCVPKWHFKHEFLKVTHALLTFPVLTYTWIMNRALQLQKAGTHNHLKPHWQDSQTNSPNIPEPEFEEVGA